MVIFKRSKKLGQGTLEYVLLMALLAGVTFTFVKVVGRDVFARGLGRLPPKAKLCISHTPDPNAKCPDGPVGGP